MHSPEWYKEKIVALKTKEANRSSGSESSKVYRQVHGKRFEYILDYAKRFCPAKDTTVLDFGRSGLTEVLNTYYSTLSTIGFPLERDSGGHRESTPLDHIPHIVCDLTKAENVDQWPQTEQKFDLIIFCEVVEHVPVAPEFQIMLLASLLKEKGKLLISTPNAINWYNRLKMVIGRNPFEKIRFNLDNPGHFREYTAKEIQHWAIETDMKVLDLEMKNFGIAFPNELLSFPRHISSLRDTVITIFEKQ